ncbi:MAG: hypothetical protein BWZ07_01410 [Alphaproteobacteria bacterium ADurb.BinA280]|nr:MAG: hypothetical protein BWZ07_01410 [Alphaproteobacteria bacterium ADurb.BinA280]
MRVTRHTQAGRIQTAHRQHFRQGLPKPTVAAQHRRIAATPIAQWQGFELRKHLLQSMSYVADGINRDAFEQCALAGQGFTQTGVERVIHTIERLSCQRIGELGAIQILRQTQALAAREQQTFHFIEAQHQIAAHALVRQPCNRVLNTGSALGRGQQLVAHHAMGLSEVLDTVLLHPRVIAQQIQLPIHRFNACCQRLGLGSPFTATLLEFAQARLLLPNPRRHHDQQANDDGTPKPGARTRRSGGRGFGNGRSWGGFGHGKILAD